MKIINRKDAQEKLQLMEALLDTIDLWAIHYRVMDKSIKPTYDKIVKYMIEDLKEINDYIDNNPADTDPNVSISDN